LIKINHSNSKGAIGFLYAKVSDIILVHTKIKERNGGKKMKKAYLCIALILLIVSGFSEYIAIGEDGRIVQITEESQSVPLGLKVIDKDFNRKFLDLLKGAETETVYDTPIQIVSYQFDRIMVDSSIKKRFSLSIKNTSYKAVTSFSVKILAYDIYNYELPVDYKQDSTVTVENIILNPGDTYDNLTTMSFYFHDSIYAVVPFVISVVYADGSTWQGSIR
jgi:hypothetical protein